MDGMYYLMAFLEGIITFVSPCLLPMLPVYISFLTGQDTRIAEKPGKALLNSAGFVLGFTVIFVLLGAFAGTLGFVLVKYGQILNIVTGLLVILFGISYLGLIKIPFPNLGNLPVKNTGSGFFPAMLFGMVFSVSWTPCVGAFLGSALALAASEAESLKGMLMLLFFSLGLGIPFIISALLIQRLKNTFDFLKRNYRTIKIISGLFLILMGILMASGQLGLLLSLLAF